MQNKPYILVIGASIIDITGLTAVKYQSHNSNPGFIKVSMGGVCRNIAENMARLGIATKFISTIGDDDHGKRILEHSRQIGYDMSDSLFLTHTSTPTYLAILDEKGEMVSAVVDMWSLSQMNANFIDSKAEIIKNATYTFVDANNPELLEHILKTYHGQTQFVLDPISAKKAESVKHLMPYFHTIKPNRFEAEAMLGYPLDNDQALIKASKDFLEKGITNIFISLDENGIFYATTHSMGKINAKDAKVVNVTGAGDSFVAALGYCYLNELPLIETVKFAMSASLLTISHENTVHPQMSTLMVRSIMTNTEWIHMQH